MNVQELQANLAEVVTRMGELANPPDGREMTDDERTEFDELETQATGLETNIEDLNRRQAAIDRLQSTGRVAYERDGDISFNVNRGRDPYDLDTIRAGSSLTDLRARLATALERDEITPDEVKTNTERLLVTVEGDARSVAMRCLATGNDPYRSAFAKLATGAGHMWTDAERAAVTRAMSLTDAQGGFAVPFTLDPTIIAIGAKSINPIRRIARVVQTTTDSWNGVTSTAATFSWDGEAAEVSDDSTTLAQPSIDVHKLQGFIPFSIEIGQDWQSIDSDLRMIIGEARDEAEAAAHLTGTGSDQPTGIITALTGGGSVVTAAGEAFTLAEVRNLQRQLPARHRQAGPVWLMNIGTANDIGSFDTAGGSDFWSNLGDGSPERLLRWRWEEHSLMDDSPDIDDTATANNYVLLVGNWSRFVIVDRVGLNVELVPHLFGNNNRPTGQRGLYAWLRNGSDSVDDNAFRMLNVATTA